MKLKVFFLDLLIKYETSTNKLIKKLPKLLLFAFILTSEGYVKYQSLIEPSQISPF